MATKETANKIAVGAGLAAAAAVAAAGAYWFYGAKDASKHRRQAKSWMLKARAEVMDALEKVGTVDKETYLAIVEGILSKYSNMKGVTAAELGEVARDLRSAWGHMEKVRKQPAKKAAKKRRAKAKKTK
jgi:hypothetical protein